MNTRGESNFIRVFRRLETDDEFKKRLFALGHYMSGRTGVSLDEAAWECAKKQRRIVEDQA